LAEMPEMPGTLTVLGNLGAVIPQIFRILLGKVNTYRISQQKWSGR